MGIRSKISIGTYYYDFPNFGDQLTGLIMTECFHLKIRYTPFSTSDLIAVGSIFDRLLSKGRLGKKEKEYQKKANKKHAIHVWGSGLMYEYDAAENQLVRPVRIHAVRGEATRQKISEILGRSVSCVLADPGILASRIIPAGEKQWDVGIIPHFRDKSMPVFQEMLEVYPNSVFIDVQQNPEIVLKQISQCRKTISTSLHGIIVSDSYNIPCCWVECSNNVPGSGYKFHDYFSSFGTDRDAFDVRDGTLPDPAVHCVSSFHSYSDVLRKQAELIRCFPATTLILMECGRRIKRKLKKMISSLFSGKN